MGEKIRIYESEIKRATRRKLMERYIDTVDEAEEMTVYNQDEFDASFDKFVYFTSTFLIFICIIFP